MRSLVACFLLVIAALLTGCPRSEPFSPVPDPGRFQQVLLIDRFNDGDTVIVDRKGFRVGRYYDFSPYEYLSISFSVRRLTSSLTSDRISLRIGPSSYFTDTISAPQRLFSFHVLCADLNKPHISAVTFLAPDSGTTLLLSHLQVVGLAP